ncbi:unnamed protein product [Schistosoma mattheei]|uniref:Uncharacterized protein n=1 Tax=Schistosoma mattheei TaxID=31246 RepID=A0A183PUS2_9TREM|nr:unnamed protein product [Schistosoma mattheei]
MLNSIEYSVEYKSYPSEVLVDINRIRGGDRDDSSVQNGITKDRNIYLYLLVVFCTIDFMLFIVHRNLAERYNRRLNGKFESSNDVFHQAAAKFRSTEDITRYSQSSLTSTENLSMHKRSYSTDNVPSDYHRSKVDNSWQLNDEPLLIEYSYEKIKEKLNQLIEIAIKKQIDIQTIPQFIAIALEKEYGRNWHVIVGPYKAGCAVTHLIGRFSNAQYASYHVIAFQTLDL